MSENVMRDGKNVEQLHISFTFTQQLIEGTQTKTRRARTSFVVEPNPKHAHLLYLPHQYTLAANATQARVEPLNELPDKPEASTALTVSSSGIVSPAAHIDAARVYRAPTINSNRGLRL
jgi:hypothetical protein